MTDQKFCDCGKPATQPVKVSTIPGSGDAKIVTIWVCPKCYVSEGWDEIDLTDTPWELALEEK